MTDNQTYETQVTAEPAEAESEIAAAGLGKFKDVQALMQAYLALEAEFTRRSQKLKELEKSKEIAAPDDAANAQAPSEAQPEDTAAQPLSDDVKNAVIQEYLASVCSGRGVPLMTGGGAVTAARRTPSTLKEAGNLAKNYFDKKEEN